MLELVYDLAHNKGMNLILSSHLLPDVEYTCDHVIVLNRGTVAKAGPIAQLKGPRGRVYELRVKGEKAQMLEILKGAGLSCHQADEDIMRVFLPDGDGARTLFALAVQANAQVRHLKPSVPTLEDVFAEAIGEE
jgi:ABC-2 type transport system ATP-binding protein